MTAQQSNLQQAWWRRGAAAGWLSCLALWAAFPPLEWSWLAWVAPVGLIQLIDRPQRLERRTYLGLWCAGTLLWLALLQGIRLAFWPLIFGWLAISLYLGIYVPLFVGIARVFRHYWRWPLGWAAPLVWTGLELVRSYLLTGFAACTLAHTQYRHPLVIQLADQIGGYGIGFVIIAVSVALFRLWGCQRERSWPRLSADLTWPGAWLLILLGYGSWRMWQTQLPELANSPVILRAALIQENTPSQFDANPERLQKAWVKYSETTARALREQGTVDLIVWPESTFTAMIPWMEDQTVARVPAEVAARNYDRQALAELVARYRSEFRNKVAILQDRMQQALNERDANQADSPGTSHLLVGNDAYVFDDAREARYNSALLIDPAGQVIARYDKMHLVMFGEYIPLQFILAFLGDAFGFSSATAGQTAQVFDVKGVRIAPSICFESMLPQVIAWQMRSLVARGLTPDVLVTITNDSWFHGSSILDHHLACEVLAAVEMRRPFLVAANTGLTAWIEGSGRLRAVSSRMQADYIIAECQRDSRWGMTQLWGDLPAWIAAVICLTGGLLAYFRSRSTGN